MSAAQDLLQAAGGPPFTLVSPAIERDEGEDGTPSGLSFSSALLEKNKVKII
jgi:hypothetical protein